MRTVKAAFSSILTWVGIALLLILLFGFILMIVEDRQIAREEADTANPLYAQENFPVREYSFVNEDAYTTFLLMVENNADQTMDFDCNTHAYDEDGEEIGVIYNRSKTIDPGGCACLEFIFENISPNSFSYELYYEEADAPSGADQLLTSEEEDENNPSTINVTCENTGSANLKYTRADIVFFSGEDAVMYDFSYVYNEPEEAVIASGDFASISFTCDEDFDRYEIYYSCQY